MNLVTLTFQITPEQRRLLKVLAAQRGVSVRALVAPVIDRLICSDGDLIPSPRQLQNQDNSLDPK